MKKGLILGLQARPAIGIVLRFAGYKEDVMETMQNLSHGTRAYLTNADFLKGFLIKYPFYR